MFSESDKIFLRSGIHKPASQIDLILKLAREIKKLLITKSSDDEIKKFVSIYLDEKQKREDL